MKTLAKLAVAAAMLGGGAIVSTAPANADVGVSIGVGGPGYYGYYSNGPRYYGGYGAYYGYDYYRPCSFYYYNELPAPPRCYSYFEEYYGPSVFFDSGFVFRDRDDYWRWHDRDDFRHWQGHDWGRANFHGGGGWGGDHGWHGDHGGWHGDHGGWHGDHGGWHH
jgi:hypothetical protein